MNHKADVSFVDSHSIGICGNHQAAILLIHKSAVLLLTLPAAAAGMIEGRVTAFLYQISVDALCLLLC